MASAERPVSFQRFDLSHNRISVKNDFPSQSLNKEVVVINDKTISYELLLNVIGRRFHECLRKESTDRPKLADEISDAELVHTVCRRERLTFYNFLKEHTSDTVLHTEEGLKASLNKEYGLYFKKGESNGRQIDIYGSTILPIKHGSVLRPNTLNKRFNVSFEEKPK